MHPRTINAMAGKNELLESFSVDRDQRSSTGEAMHPYSPIMATSSEIEVIAPSNIITPSQELRSSFNGGNDSNTTDVMTCSSTATDDMLDTVDDCVGCVNQISLQHDFEDSLRDVALNLQHASSSIPPLPSDDETIDIASNVAAGDVDSLFLSISSASTTVVEETQQDSQMDLLNWCSGGFHGVNSQ